MSNQLMQTGGCIHQELLQATGRTHHQLVQSADCVHRQLMLGVGRALTQSSQVEGRLHRALLQDAGRVQYQLLMAAGRSYLHDGQQGHRGPEDVQEGGEEGERTTEHGNTVHLYSAACYNY